MSPTIARIHLAALRANLEAARDLAPSSRIFAVIKADAYGHGSVRCAQALNQADGFAVATVDEALLLREQDIDKPILVLSRFCHADEVRLIQEYKLLPVIHNHSLLDLLINHHRGEQPVNCWLKVDTGMNRLGMDADELRSALKRIHASRHVNAVGLMSHLACADETENNFTNFQMRRFLELTAGENLSLSIANSAAIMAWPDTHRDWNRPGIMLYGASPIVTTRDSPVSLQPVMSLTSELVSASVVKTGEGVGYGQTFIAPRDMMVGIVACGYADGYPRHAGTGTPVLVCNTRCRVLGRVSMDTLAVDLDPAPQARIGSPVELWGSNLPVNEIASHAGTIAYELLTRVSRRVPRQYID